MQMLTRREMLRLSTAAGAAAVFGRGSSEAQSLTPAIKAVDHLLLGISDLDKGMAWVEKTTGVRAVIGGSHPGVGTRNALLSLGGQRYLEIIAPDPAQPPENLTRNLRTLAQPRLIAWASANDDLDALARQLRARTQELIGPSDGSRVRPDGRKLAWRSLALQTTFERDGIDPIPFFIEWARDSAHPSLDSPSGCDLMTFAIEHPVADAVKASLAQAGIDADVRQAPTCRLIATLNTPMGRVVLS